MLLLLGDAKSSSLGLLLLSTTINLGCSHLRNYNHPSPRIQSKLEIQEVGSAGNGFPFYSTSVTLSWDKVCSCPEILYGSTLQAADQVLPLLKSLKDGLLTTAGLGHHRGFSLPFGLFDTIAWFLFFFSSIKQNAAAAQNVTTCPFYCQLRLYWSLSIFAFTTQ